MKNKICSDRNINHSWAERLGFVALLSFMGFRHNRRSFNTWIEPVRPNPEIEAAAEAKRQRRQARNLKQEASRRFGVIASLLHLRMERESRFL